MWTLNTGYYDVWGTPIAAYGLVQCYNRLGYLDLITEDILDHLTIGDQIRLLGTRSCRGDGGVA